MTEPLLIDFGPLQRFIGQWYGDKGQDRSPEPDGVENNAYREMITFEPLRRVSNAEEQILAALHYRQTVYRLRDNKQIHDQTGYLMWDAATDHIMYSFTLARGLNGLAGGLATTTRTESEITVTAGRSEDWPIQQSPFMTNKAKTLSFDMTMKVNETELSYHQTTVVDIYGAPFDHTDSSTLKRVQKIP